MYILHNENVLTYLDYAPVYNGLNVAEFGKETVLPKVSSPSYRNNYILHFVLDGEGIFVCDGKSYAVPRGKAFVITPKNLVRYDPVGGKNWTYCWISLSGTDCEALFEQCGLTGLHVLDYDPRDIARLSEMIEQIAVGSYQKNPCVFSVLVNEMCFNVFGNLAKKLRTETPDSPGLSVSIINTAIAYMRRNLHKQLNVTSLCRELHVSRTYFSTLFERTLNKSPYRYLNNLRIQRASELLLSEKNLHVCEIAEMVGFSSAAQFCKAFRKQTSFQPSAFRRKYEVANEKPETADNPTDA